jgi:hypothetical protein
MTIGRLRATGLLVLCGRLLVAGAALAEPAGSSWRWSGDLRVRYLVSAYIHGAKTVQTMPIRVRLGGSGQSTDGRWAWGVQVATNPNFVWAREVGAGGGNMGARADVGIDHAWLSYRAKPHWQVTAGKAEPPFWVTEAIIDPDITAEHLSATYTTNLGGWRVSNVGSYLPLNANAPLASFAVGDQLRAGRGQLDGALAWYQFLGTHQAPTPLPMDHLSVLHGRAVWTVPTRTRIPVQFGVDGFYNLSARTRAAGWELRADLPRVGRSRFSYCWRQVGLNATYANWADNEVGDRTGIRSAMRAEWYYRLCQNLTFRIGACHFEPTTGNPKSAAHRLKMDFTARF